jgi:hypothetical protein
MEADMQKWEYYRVSIVDNSNLPGPHSMPSRVYLVGPDGKRKEREKLPGDENSGRVVSRALGQLGDEGFELAGVVSVAGEVVLYFKRPKVISEQAI